MVERFEVALNTPAGRLTTAIDVPTGFIPITAIVPVTRRLGEEGVLAMICDSTNVLVEGSSGSEAEVPLSLDKLIGEFDQRIAW